MYRLRGDIGRRIDQAPLDSNDHTMHGTYRVFSQLDKNPTKREMSFSVGQSRATFLSKDGAKIRDGGERDLVNTDSWLCFFSPLWETANRTRPSHRVQRIEKEIRFSEWKPNLRISGSDAVILLTKPHKTLPADELQCSMGARRSPDGLVDDDADLRR